eukprot:TRINITY_DN42032_c0_g1_i1.p2 TRINITY_DN42032_c0_g1~~TRINITY_DN42032_c0_g1_i1.p2  ORF type:complete len:152 (-),score=14.83 TRINITY_DN42032_c0_g1_i1:125-559(-)
MIKVQVKPKSNTTTNPQQRPIIQRIPQKLASIGFSLVLLSSPALAQTNFSVEQSFNLKCAGCHMAGGNVVQGGATLFLGDLERNGYLDVDKLYEIISLGKGKMPGFGEQCTPKGKCTFAKRLTDEEIGQLDEYILSQANLGWKK